MASPPFSAYRLNPSTFRITENSLLSKTPAEKPQIYLKFYDTLIVIIDTGSARKPDNQTMTLRKFIETVPVAENGEKPLNEAGKREYVLVMTHCHFDRIGGISEFPTSTVSASSAAGSFLAPATLPAHSLCELVAIPTPTYTPTLFLEDGGTFPHVAAHETPLTALHTPGHTPDSLSLYDPEERTLFVGDTLYENTAMTFPSQGNLQAYMASLDKLLALVDKEGGQVKLAAGRGVWDSDAAVFVGFVKQFMERVLSGDAKGESKGESRGIKVIQYNEQKAAFFGPERVFDEGRRALGYPCAN